MTLESARKAPLDDVNAWLADNEFKMIATRYPVPHVGAVVMGRVKRLHLRHGLIEMNPIDVSARLEGDMDGDEVQVEKLAPEHEAIMDDYISKLNVKGINLKNYLPKDANKKIFSNKAQRDEIIRALAFGGDAIAKVANMMNVYGQVRTIVDSINTSSIEGFGDTKSIRIRGLDESIYFEPEGKAIPYREYLRRYIQAALDNAGLREGLAATKADMAFKSQQARLENIQARGQQQNLGQSGKSAQKAIAALLSSYGQGQIAMADSITRAESKYMLDRRQVAETLSHKDKLTNLNYRQINNTLLNSIKDAEGAKRGIGLKFDQLKERTEFGREQIQQSIISATEQDAANRNRITMDKYQQDIQASKLITSRPTPQPAESLPLQIPDTNYIDPQKPTPPPKPVLGANTVPQQGMLSKVGQVMDIAAAGVGIAQSDIQLKENITLIGKSGKGLPIYEFNYKGDRNQRYQGVMAQDLLTTDYANSVITGSDGFYRVDYSQLDVAFKKV